MTAAVQSPSAATTAALPRKPPERLINLPRAYAVMREQSLAAMVASDEPSRGSGSSNLVAICADEKEVLTAVLRSRVAAR